MINNRGKMYWFGCYSRVSHLYVVYICTIYFNLFINLYTPNMFVFRSSIMTQSLQSYMYM